MIKQKKAYKEKSELILSNLSNAIMYYHEGPNKNYCSIGIFEDKERNKDEEILTIFIQCNKNKYFITKNIRPSSLTALDDRYMN